jgi:hypothetical protein
MLYSVLPCVSNQSVVEERRTYLDQFVRRIVTDTTGLSEVEKRDTLRNQASDRSGRRR